MEGVGVRWMMEFWRDTSAWRRWESVERRVSDVGSAESAAKHAFIPETTSPRESRTSAVQLRCISTNTMGDKSTQAPDS